MAAAAAAAALVQTLIWPVEFLAHSLPLMVMTSCWMLSHAVGFGWFIALASSHSFPPIIFLSTIVFYHFMML